MSRDWLLYLDDLIDSAEKMQRFLKGRAFEEFASDEMLFDAVLFNLEVIGEAVKQLPADVRSREPTVEWQKIAGLRDILIHQYFGIDVEIL